MSQKLGVIICNYCEKEVGTFHTEKVSTRYGVCEKCKAINEQKN
ncbi:GapA-binding peptide SR1P [Shouchella clausii]